MKFKIDKDDKTIKLKVASVTYDGGSSDSYTGSYDIQSSITVDQTLLTENKLMKKDLNIEKLPTLIVSNAQGGLTYTIG